MVEHVHPLGVEIDPLLDIADKRIVGPAVPQPGDDVEELPRPAIALAVFHVLGQTEIQCGIRVGGGDQIPRRAPAADVVERGKAAGDRIGRLEGGGCRRDQPEMLGHHRQHRQQGQRVERGHRRAVLQGRHRHVEHTEMVGHEPRVEAALFELLRKTDQVLEIEVGVGPGAGIAPPRRMDAHGPHERTQPHLPRTCHSCCSPVAVTGILAARARNGGMLEFAAAIGR